MDSQIGQNTSLRVTDMLIQHTNRTAALHRAILPHGLFPRLGHGYMTRWHRTFVDSPFAVALAAVDDEDRIHGFLIATTDEARYKQQVLSQWRWPLSWRGALGLAIRPPTALHFLRTRVPRYATRLLVRHPAGPSVTADHPSAEQFLSTVGTGPVGVVHAVACNEHSRGAGVGAALLAEYEARAQSARTHLAQLITRETGGAAKFYSRFGWVETERRADRDGNTVIQLDRKFGPP